MKIGSCQVKGFTLLEVMVALAIFAVLSVTLIRSAYYVVNQQSQLEERVVATWLAQYELSQIRLVQPGNPRLPQLGKKEKEVHVSSRDWRVEIAVTSTENQFIRKVSVSVTPIVESMRDAAPVANLSGFVGEH